MKNGTPKGFDSAREKAEEFAKDKETAGHLLDEAVRKANRNKRVLEEIWADLQALFRMIRAWLNGYYRTPPWQSVIFAIACVVYFVNPFDIVPDFIPGAGFIDDATVLGFVIRSIKQDIVQFLEWEAKQEKTR